MASRMVASVTSLLALTDGKEGVARDEAEKLRMTLFGL